MITLKNTLASIIKDHNDSLAEGDFRTAVQTLNAIESLMNVILKLKIYKVK